MSNMTVKKILGKIPETEWLTLVKISGSWHFIYDNEIEGIKFVRDTQEKFLCNKPIDFWVGHGMAVMSDAYEVYLEKALSDLIL